MLNYLIRHPVAWGEHVLEKAEVDFLKTLLW